MMVNNKYKFQKLTPVDDVDLAMYEDALNFVFDNPDIRNVAISGAYGAGKSSVLASYKKKHKEYKFIHISLAHFEQPDKNQRNQTTDSNEDKDDTNSPKDSHNKNSGDSIDNYGMKESVLEGKILNQLIHQIPAEKIPQTNFKVKKKSSTQRIAVDVALIMLFTVSLLHVLFFNSWNIFVTSLPDIWIKSLLSISTNKLALVVSGMLCATTFCIFLFWIIKAQKNRNIFRKISLQGNEIEIFEESEESYFDKYLNEVLYLFESVEADVIVFEDMDRFNANRIFERLREVNTLANIQLKKEKRSPIRFFYLLRDDIFVNKDRTKFFDYIMPVVPVVDSSNSYDQFISHFKDGGFFDRLEESFLQGLSLYVDEMRILKNIYNEFVIYYNRLNTIELNCNKMLAMITYKNLFPRDFNDLQLNRGFVYTLFANKNKFIQEEISKLRQRTSQKNEEIEQANNEHLLSQQELTIIYDQERRKDYYGRLNAQDQEEYDKRKLAIDNKLNDNCSSIQEYITELENQIIALRSKQLKDIISRSNIDSIFRITTTNEIGVENNFNEIKECYYFSLLKYLIRNGYIDETYTDYMTYFYENSLSRIDKTFLRSITDKIAKEHTYQLKNPSLVVSRLRLVDFDQEEILNFDLLQYLLQTPSNSDFLERFLQQLRQTKNTKFVGAYFDTERGRPAYIRCLNVQWPNLFSYALTNSALSNKQLRLYSIFTLYYSSDSEIKEVNVDNFLTQYISDSADYLRISEPDVEKLIHGFILLGVSFRVIDPEQINEELFAAVYNESLYEINFNNISLMLHKFYSVNDDNKIQHHNYSIIMSEPESPLATHIQENIGQYVDAVLSSSNGIITDEEKYALLLLNNSDVLPEQKTEYINQLKTAISSLAVVEDKTLWVLLLDKRLAEYSVNNIIDYWENKGSIDSALISFINSNASPLDFSTVSDIYGKEKADNLFDAVVICNELSNNKYEEILTSLGFNYIIFDVQGISGEKLIILIDKNIIPMTADTLVFIRDNYPGQAMHFIKHNVNEYVDILTSESFDINEALETLNWDVNDDVKIKLLGYTTEPLSIVDKNYPIAVRKYILENNLDSDDLSPLFMSYDNWPNEIQAVILGLAAQNIAIVTSEPNKVSHTLLNDLFSSSQITDAQKIDLFVAALQYFDTNNCTKVLNTLGLQEYNKIFEPRRRPKFEISDISRKLLTAFRDNDRISDFEEDPNKTGFYRIIRNRPTTKTLSTELL